MNCQLNQVAYIAKALKPQNVGKPVRVIAEAEPDAQYGALWWVKSTSPLVCLCVKCGKFHGDILTLVRIPDAWLTPICATAAAAGAAA